MDELIAELKQKIVEGLHLEDITPDAIDEDAPLFVEGLGLDSIDAVELVVILEKSYGILLTEMETARAAFASVRRLAEFVAAARQERSLSP
ncbi:MAG: acyl carrier protein [Planctomycetes bacterium]|nr:acyl carrier protein [Planctomycetota bacterium]